MRDLNEGDALFQQAAGKQIMSTEILLAVPLVIGVRLLGQIQRCGKRLHGDGCGAMLPHGKRPYKRLYNCRSGTDTKRIARITGPIMNRIAPKTFLCSSFQRMRKRMRCAYGLRMVRSLAAVLIIGLLTSDTPRAAQLWAGVGKVEISDDQAGPVESPPFVKALIIRNQDTTAAIITVDAVAVGEIGHIGNDYLGTVRSRLENEFGIEPTRVMINASHCHAVVCDDVDQRTVQAVRQAWQSMVPVKVGAGVGHEDRIMENRRLKLKNGKEIDVRHAYSLPPDDDIAEVGPVDPEIGVLRLDTIDGETIAVVYNFACHPIQGVPSGANTADLTGFASAVIEENMGERTVAFFLQGCAGDINPINYKAVDHPRDAERLGNMLGLSTLKAARTIETTEDGRLAVVHEMLELPRADVGQRIVAMETEQQRLLQSLRGTYLNLKSFLPLAVKYGLSEEFPSADAYRYLHEDRMGRNDLRRLDTLNRANMQQYIRNVQTMEQLTRINTNLSLLRKHQADLVDGGKRTIDVELLGLRIGDFVLTTFPGELTVRIGLNIKRASAHDLTFVAGYTNGYIYYAPTAEQLANVGGAQEDSDCILAPQWQSRYEEKVGELLKTL